MGQITNSLEKQELIMLETTLGNFRDSFTNPLQTSAGEGGPQYPLQWFLHWALWFYPLVALLGGGTNTKCCLPVLGD